MVTEIWKAIPGFKGMYDASSLGRIRSWRCSSKNRIKAKRPHLMAQSNSNDSGYDIVHLVKGHHAKHYSVHRLIAKTFCPNPHNYTQVDHINGVITCNKASNLRFTSIHANNNFLLHKKHIKRGSFYHIGIGINTKCKKFRFISMMEAAKWLQSHIIKLSHISKHRIVNRLSYKFKRYGSHFVFYGLNIKCYKYHHVNHDYHVVYMSKGPYKEIFLSTKPAAEYLKYKLHLTGSIRTIESGISKRAIESKKYYGYTVTYLYGQARNHVIIHYITRKLQHRFGTDFKVLKRTQNHGRYYLTIKYLPKNIIFTMSQIEVFRRRRKKLSPYHHIHEVSARNVILMIHDNPIRFKMMSQAARYLRKYKKLSVSSQSLAKEMARPMKRKNNHWHIIHGVRFKLIK